MKKVTTDQLLLDNVNKDAKKSKIVGFLLILFGVPEVREWFRKVSGASTLHPGRIWARTEPYGPHSPWFL